MSKRWISSLARSWDAIRSASARTRGRAAPAACDGVLAGGVDPDLLAVSRAIASAAVLPTLSVTPGRKPTSISSRNLGQASADGIALDDRVGEGPLPRFQLCRREVAVDRVDLDGRDGRHGMRRCSTISF